MIARMPDPLGRACIFPGDERPCVTAVDVCVIRPAADTFNHRWLMWFVNTPPVRAAIAGLQAGSTRKRISRKNLGTIPLPVPPIAEQGLIVEQIESQLTRLAAGAGALKRVQANLKRYRAAVLRAACEGRLVPTEAELARREGRSFQPASVLLQRIKAEEATTAAPHRPTKHRRDAAATEFPDVSPLPEGWSWASLTQLVSARGIRTGPFGSLLKKREHRTDGVPVLGVENVRSLRFTHGSKIHVSPEKARALAAYSAEPGDILLSRSGTVGEACVVPASVEAARFSTNIIRIALDSEVAAPHFLVVLLYGSPQVLDQLQTLTGGSTRDFLNQRILKSIRFPLAPLAEQHRIVAEVERRLALAENLEREVQANLERSARLRGSILASAFSGQLTSRKPEVTHVSALL